MHGVAGDVPCGAADVWAACTAQQVQQRCMSQLRHQTADHMLCDLQVKLITPALAAAKSAEAAAVESPGGSTVGSAAALPETA